MVLKWRSREAVGLVGVLLALWSGMVLGSRYQAAMDESSWEVNASIFECKLSHNIPFYGQAVFERGAGEAARFRLQSSTPRLESGKAALVAKPPLWKPGVAAQDLGYVPVARGKAPIVLDDKYAAQLLEVLFDGREVEFTRAPWYPAEASSRVVLSTVNFQAAYGQYLNCLAALLPVNFEQIRRTAIYFRAGSASLAAAEEVKLDRIALYVQADRSVESFFIDGHTDSDGSREDNLELSRRRAEMVTELLVKRGISAERITTRWHGERYPVASNRDASGRGKNRRVTIRLEKTAGPVVPTLARTEPGGAG
ncbi:MAG: OmpA family protein [Gammaproteobacteria bacterium]|nr:OmpA family protein [Gammaproteobacteria bacterium]